MSARVSPYLNFTGTAAAAFTHYHRVLGGQLDSQTFAEFGMEGDPADADLVMHCQLTFGEDQVLMGADLPHSMRSGEPAGPTTPVTLFGDDEATLRRWWDGLVEGGTVDAPLEKAPWGDSFGMCTDAFGARWMVNISAPATG